MSDAMTNREIEDVLTSIRRLVSQEGTRNAEIGRLVLTESQRISPVSPLAETLVADPDGARPSTTDLAFPAPDFGRLEATIAELEAAVTASGGTWEADSTIESPRASNVTELYGRLSVAHRAKSDLSDADPLRPTALPPPVEASPAEAPPVLGAADIGDSAPKVAADRAEPAPALSVPPAGDDDIPILALPQIDPLLASERLSDPEPSDPSADDLLIDEATLRALIVQIVRDELHGVLGEKITLQVRKLVRAEIAKALDDRKFL